MRIAVLSDVHGNLQALRATLADADACRVDRVWCLGDTVGYGADPDACVALLRGHEAVGVLGNHDAALVGKFDAARFNPVARAAIEWTRRVVRLETLEWLKRLPLKWCGVEGTLVHGSLDGAERFPYVAEASDAAACLAAATIDPVFLGHTHKPAVWHLSAGGCRPCTVTVAPGTLPLPAEGASLVNVGSVGQPRDNDARARWVLYDSDARTVSFRAVEYDWREAGRRIRAAGLPESLAERLAVGG